ncbi:hypothetical protein ABBQ32_012423 [Trebouxia sp. C0010 RCD-2024]
MDAGRVSVGSSGVQEWSGEGSGWDGQLGSQLGCSGGLVHHWVMTGVQGGSNVLVDLSSWGALWERGSGVWATEARKAGSGY